MDEASSENIRDDQITGSKEIALKIEPGTESGVMEQDDSSHRCTDSDDSSSANLVEEPPVVDGEDEPYCPEHKVKTEIISDEFQYGVFPPLTADRVTENNQSNASSSEIKYSNGSCSPNHTVITETESDEYRPSIYLTPSTYSGLVDDVQSNTVFPKSMNSLRLVNSALTSNVNDALRLCMDPNNGTESLYSLLIKDLIQSSYLTDDTNHREAGNETIDVDTSFEKSSQERNNKTNKKEKPKKKEKKSRLEKKSRSLKGTYTCEICNKTYGYKGGLTRHAKSEHVPDTMDKTIIACSFCDKVFTRKETLKRHEVRHLGTPSFICDKCGKPYFRSDKYMDHLDVHKAAENQRFMAKIQHPAESIPTTVPIVQEFIEDCSVKCPLCNQVQRHKRNLYRHLRVFHAKETNPDKPVKQYTCKDCNNTYKTYGAYHHHIQKHKQPRPCNLCGKSFYRVDHLKAHLATHERLQQRMTVKQLQPIVQRPRGRLKGAKGRPRTGTKANETENLASSKANDKEEPHSSKANEKDGQISSKANEEKELTSSKANEKVQVVTPEDPIGSTHEPAVKRRRKRQRIRFNEEEQIHERISESE